MREYTVTEYDKQDQDDYENNITSIVKRLYEEIINNLQHINCKKGEIVWKRN